MAVAEAAGEPWVPRDTFGARLALIRQAMGGWNVKKAASFCGIDDQSWRNWESKPDANPQRYEAVCRQIADRTGCDIHWLKGGGPLSITCFSASTLPRGVFPLSLLDEDGEPVDFYGRAELTPVPS